MRVGVTLPSFRDDAFALDAARRAEALGLDGVFAFDHLWPLRRPDRPALSCFVLLGAVAGATSRVAFGPLVARIGLAPDDLLVAQLASLAAMAPGRVIAGIGTGDSQSRPENDAYGIEFAPAATRRASLARCAEALCALGIPVWVGGGGPATDETASARGAAVNLWEGDVAAVAAVHGRAEVTWAGPVPGDERAVRARLDELADAGATWAVCAWPDSLEVVAAAAEAHRSDRGPEPRR
jgi:alkanesulfonate monooxygenase SsuD/methylene tetrahydromethanopterin reductase-like flavin-dependent oxidoreductase (luciferase family)